MSSLRDSFLARHRALEPELARRARAALAEALPAPTRPALHVQLWRELILPARPAWAALAAAWVVLFAIHTVSKTHATTGSEPARERASTLAADTWAKQRLHFADLLSAPAHPSAPSAPVPETRSRSSSGLPAPSPSAQLTRSSALV